MSLSNGRAPGPHSIRHPSIRPSDRSFGLVPNSGPPREVPQHTVSSSQALDHDTQGIYYSRSQDSATPWDASRTWSDGVFAHSSPLQFRPETAQSYQTPSNQSFRGGQPSRMDNKLHRDSTQWFPERQVNLSASDRGASRRDASFTGVPNSSFRSSGLGLHDAATGEMQRFQNPAPNQENAFENYVDPRLTDWQSTEDMVAHQGGIDPPVEEDDMPPPTKVFGYTAHLRNEDTIGSDDLWTQTAGKGLMPSLLVSQAPKSGQSSRLNSSTNSRATKKRMPLVERPGLGNITSAKLQEPHRPKPSILAEQDGNIAGGKRPASRQSGSQSDVKKPRKTPSSVHAPCVGQYVTISTGQTISASRALTANHSPGVDSTDAESPGLELARSACMRCRRLHSKCDRFLPACGSCVKLGRACTYPHSVMNSALHGDEREILQGSKKLPIDGSHQEEAPDVSPEVSSGLQQPSILSEMGQGQKQGTLRGCVAMTDAGTGPDVVFLDIATQTNRPARLQMDLYQWSEFTKSALELHRNGINTAARIVEEAGRTSPEIRETLLKAARVGWNVAQNLREIYQASSTHLDRHEERNI